MRIPVAHGAVAACMLFLSVQIAGAACEDEHARSCSDFHGIFLLHLIASSVAVTRGVQSV